MSEERRKILEMLSDGKITVDDAERLLRAVGEGDAHGPRGAGDDEGDLGLHARVGVDLGDLEQQIRDRVEAARRTVRASMPRLRTVIRDSAPDVERIVEEATASIPGFVEEMTGAFRNAFGGSFRRAFGDDAGHDDDDYLCRVERDLSADAPVEAGSQLVLHNPRGRLEVETWDQERVQAEVHVTARAHDEETARRCADAVQLVPEPGAGRLVLRPVLAPEEDASVRLDIRLRLPARLDLDLHTAHGDLVVPEMAGDLALGSEHGELRLAGTSGSASVENSHGKVFVGRVGGRLSLSAHHSQAQLDEVVQEANLNAHHGRLQLRRVGGNALINAHHAPLEVDEIHGDATANNHHAPVDMRQVRGDLAINSHHSPVTLHEVGGDLRLANHHGPVDVDRVGGDLSAQSSHSPLQVGSIGRSATVRSSHGPVDLGPAGGAVTVEADHCPIAIGGAGGRVTVRSDRGEVRIDNAAGEVMVENTRAGITVMPAGPVRSAYTISNSRGSVRLHFPEGSAVDVQGFVRRGRVDTDLPLEVSANGQQGQSVSGALGDGGPAVQIEVDGGDLALRRA